MLMLSIIPLRPDVWQTLGFSAAGFILVMGVLLVLSLGISVIGVFFKLSERKADKTAPAQQKPKTVKLANAELPADHAYAISAAVASVVPELKNDSAELLAVLTAAATVALDGERARVVNFKPVDFNYSRYGREQIFAEQNYIPVKNRKH